jgi:hypothetical protein
MQSGIKNLEVFPPTHPPPSAEKLNADMNDPGRLLYDTTSIRLQVMQGHQVAAGGGGSLGGHVPSRAPPHTAEAPMPPLVTLAELRRKIQDHPELAAVWPEFGPNKHTLHPIIDLPSSFDGSGNTYRKLPPGMCPPSLAASNCIAPSTDLGGSIPLLGGGDSSLPIAPTHVHAGSVAHAHAHRADHHSLGPLGDSSATLAAAQLVEFAARFPRHDHIGGSHVPPAADDGDAVPSRASAPVANTPTNAIGRDNGSRDDASAVAERAPVESDAARAIRDFDSLLTTLDGQAPPPPPHTLLFGDDRKGGSKARDASGHADELASDAVPSTPDLLRALRDQRQRFKQWAAANAHASAVNAEAIVAETDPAAPAQHSAA